MKAAIFVMFIFVELAKVRYYFVHMLPICRIDNLKPISIKQLRLSLRHGRPSQQLLSCCCRSRQQEGAAIGRVRPWVCFHSVRLSLEQTDFGIDLCTSVMDYNYSSPSTEIERQSCRSKSRLGLRLAIGSVHGNAVGLTSSSICGSLFSNLALPVTFHPRKLLPFETLLQFVQLLKSNLHLRF